MTDIEKVIEGFEMSYRYSNVDENNTLVPQQLVLDALALLKAQEPRVLTAEEYDAWIDIPFTERDPVFHEERTKRGSITCWTNTTVCPLHEYGKNDRCWTSRPTDEQREAVKWK